MQLPIPACDLVQAWDLLYERSLGCVGIVKEWLLRAVTMALADGKATFDANASEGVCAVSLPMREDSRRNHGRGNEAQRGCGIVFTAETSSGTGHEIGG